MNALWRIAERRIEEAAERGELDGLEGQGRPLVFEDDTWVPEDLRMAFRVLRNAGFLPPEAELRKEIFNLRELISTIDDDAERLRRIRELEYKLVKLAQMRPGLSAEAMDRIMEGLFRK